MATAFIQYSCFFSAPQTSSTQHSPSSLPPVCHTPPVKYRSHKVGTTTTAFHSSDSKSTNLLPDGDVGLQLGDAVLYRLLAVVAVRRGYRHDNTGLTHLHPSEGEQVSLNQR